MDWLIVVVCIVATAIYNRLGWILKCLEANLLTNELIRQELEKRGKL